MRIDKLQVHNFRGFSDTEIVLNGKDAIFYGVNGMGKSSILDVCNLLFSRIMEEAGQDEQITASLLGEKDVKVGEEEKITLFLEDQGNNFHYYRKRIQGKNLHISKEMKRVSEYIRTELLEQINVYLNEKAYDEAAEYTITKLNLNDKRLCRVRENALWTFNVFQLNGEEKQRELKKFECSEEVPPYWDAIKYFLTQGD